MATRIGIVAAVMDLLCHGVAVVILIGREPLLGLVYVALFVRSGLTAYTATHVDRFEPDGAVRPAGKHE